MTRVTGPGPSLRSQWLGERMRRIRKGLRIPQQEAADHIQRNNSMLGRYESGEIPFRRNDVIDLLDFYGVSSELERNGLLQLCDEVWRKDWWDPHTDDFGQDFVDIPWLESRAERICVYQHIIVHGLLQTREYADTLIRYGAGERTREVQIAKWIDLRIERQHVLHKDDPTRFAIVLEESALVRPVGRREEMQAQLRLLAELGELENIEVQVIPTAVGPHAALRGSFQLYEMPDPYPDVAHVETVGGSLYIEEPTVSHIREVWKDLVESALSPEESNALVKRYLEGEE
ncbi:helix-turn-helix domain-containing protein [Glycomyces buryatensis]|uniref:Helix-turn-helix domain-containing protein n=1 Tax=Glycomyces buryatensis TaxID=2570927 RepID=A0A4S8QIL0_9ACTN|nr:helix-turn-helix transcriptional regulator [Glycomyces buryatensis]THV43591.1 helix-turn-helix domain-containing protein [Glycomyces buryatensis]